MTNREKHIDNASDKELAKIIGKSASVHKNELILFGDRLEVDEIEKRLSQETEEETASPIMSKALMKVDERMAKLEQRINENKIRIDKLEEERKTKDPKDFSKADISYGVIEKTADKMFEELGYEIVDGSIPNIQYCKIDEGRKVVIELNRYVHIKYFSDFDIRDISFINEAEDKAIHKKLEELKNAR